MDCACAFAFTPCLSLVSDFIHAYDGVHAILVDQGFSKSLRFHFLARDRVSKLVFIVNIEIWVKMVRVKKYTLASVSKSRLVFISGQYLAIRPGVDDDRCYWVIYHMICDEGRVPISGVPVIIFLQSYRCGTEGCSRCGAARFPGFALMLRCCPDTLGV